MLVLEQEHLAQFVEELRQQWPESITLYMLAKNQLQQNRFAWPSTEFVVDKFPHYSACVVRPIPHEKRKQDKDYPPRIPVTKYTVYGRDEESLRKLLEEPGVIDWTVPSTFGPTAVRLVETLYGVCKEHGQINTRPDWTGVLALIFKPGQLNPGPELPDGFTIRPLDRTDIVEVNATWSSGRSPECLRTMLYLYDNGFPTIGAFDSNNKLAGFEICNTEMCMIAAYVKPEYRNKKLFHSMSHAFCEAMFVLGEEMTYAFVSGENVASHTSMRRLGGQWANWQVCWAYFVPKGYDDPTDPLVLWYKNLGEILWEQK